MNKRKLTTELKRFCIPVKNGYVCKAAIKRALAKFEKNTEIVAMVPGGGTKVKVDVSYDEIMEKAHNTYAPDTYYKSFDSMPEAIRKAFEEANPVVDRSRYTVGNPTAFIRIEVETKDEAIFDMQYSLGKIEDEEKDEDYNEDYNEDDDEENDKDAYYEEQAYEMKSVCEFNDDIYFEIVESPELHTNEKFEEWKKAVNEFTMNKVGIHPEDLGDYNWRDAFEEDVSIEEAYELWKDSLSRRDFDMIEEAEKLED